MIRTVGPVWDGNEVWLLVAGGATFAAFPEWYATMFSGFYLALFLVLVGLISRGVAFEFRGKVDSPRWRRLWDEALFWGSALPALLFGVAFADLLHGVPINASHELVGSFFSLLDFVRPLRRRDDAATLRLARLGVPNPQSNRRRSGASADDRESARLANGGRGLRVPCLDLRQRDACQRQRGRPGLVPISALGAAIAVALLLPERHEGWAFLANGLAIVLLTATIFLNLYPRHGFEPQSRLRSNHLQRVVHPLHSRSNDRRRGHLHPDRPDLPVLDLLDSPEAHRPLGLREAPGREPGSGDPPRPLREWRGSRASGLS